MVQVMWETVFLQVLVPEGKCEIIFEKDACEAVPNSIAPSTPQCEWQGKRRDGKCIAADPPGDFTFNAIIACAIIIFSLPCQFFLSYVASFIFMNPDWSSWSFKYNLSSQEQYLSGLNELGQHNSKVQKTASVEKYNEPFGNNIKVNDDTDNQEYAPVDLEEFASTVIASADESATISLMQKSGINESAFTSINDEATFIYLRVKALAMDLEETTSPAKSNNIERGKKVLEELRFYFGLDDWQKAINEQHILKKIENHLQSAHEGCDQILEALKEIEKEGFDDYVRDDYLLREFIIERFYEKSTPAQDALAPDYLNLDRVDPVLWCFSWAFVFAVWWFCCYWCLVWGIKNGEAMLVRWITEFGSAVVQDILVFIPFVVIIFKTATVLELEPQMRHLYTVMKRIAESHSVNSYPSANQINHFQIIHHFSPASRAAQILSGQSLEEDVLPNARFILFISDEDAFDMRERRSKYFDLTLFMVMIAPILWVISGLFFELFIEFFIPITWSGFTIANSIFYMRYQPAFIAFYTLVGLFLLHYFKVFAYIWESRKNTQNNGESVEN